MAVGRSVGEAKSTDFAEGGPALPLCKWAWYLEKQWTLWFRGISHRCMFSMAKLEFLPKRWWGRMGLKVLKMRISMSTLPPPAIFLCLFVWIWCYSQKAALNGDPRWKGLGKRNIFQLLSCAAFLLLKTQISTCHLVI